MECFTACIGVLLALCIAICLVTVFCLCVVQYCREQDRQMLIDLYYQDDKCGDSANIHVQDALQCKVVS